MHICIFLFQKCYYPSDVWYAEILRKVFNLSQDIGYKKNFITMDSKQKDCSCYMQEYGFC